jgi:hypothetical protein
MQSVFGLPPATCCLHFGSKKHRRHRFERASLDTCKTPECFAFQLFDRFKSQPPIAEADQTVVNKKLCKGSSENHSTCSRNDAYGKVCSVPKPRSPLVLADMHCPIARTNGNDL